MPLDSTVHNRFIPISQQKTKILQPPVFLIQTWAWYTSSTFFDITSKELQELFFSHMLNYCAQYLFIISYAGHLEWCLIYMFWSQCLSIFPLFQIAQIKNKFSNRKRNTLTFFIQHCTLLTHTHRVVAVHTGVIACTSSFSFDELDLTTWTFRCHSLYQQFLVNSSWHEHSGIIT